MIWSLLISLLLFWQIPSPAAQVRNDTDPVIPSEAKESQQEEEVDVAGIIFEHIGDEYEWHILTWGDTHVILHLPVIVHSSTGWHVFSSKHLEHGESYEGLVIDPEKGKIVEVLLVIILCTARWYKKHDVLNEAPTGIAALVEPLVMMVHDMARENIGEEDYRKYSPYLCMAFLFILLNNFMGILPFFPGGANLTGNIAITLVLALCTFFTVNLTGTRHYYKEIFNPDVPLFLKPIMPVIEVFSALMKPVSLTIRLFANMLAGHIMILSVVCVIFIMAKYGPVLTGSMSVVSVLFGLFLDALECLVAFIQAYVFTTLSSIYIGLARAHGE